MQHYIDSVDKHFNAMVDSVNVIESLVALGVKSMASFEEVDRNYRHLEFMLDRDDIILDGRDLTPFEDAIALGRAFTGFAKV